LTLRADEEKTDGMLMMLARGAASATYCAKRLPFEVSL